LSELAQRQADIDLRFDETIAEQLEPIMQAGQRLETHLRELSGKKAPTTIHFPDTEIVIVEAGGKVTNQQLTSVQRVVKERLEDMESELKSQKQRETEFIQMEKNKVRAEADLGMEGLRNQLDDQALAVRDENARLRTSYWSCAADIHGRNPLP